MVHCLAELKPQISYIIIVLLVDNLKKKLEKSNLSAFNQKGFQALKDEEKHYNPNNGNWRN
jgi:hypothetical protein